MEKQRKEEEREKIRDEKTYLKKKSQQLHQREKILKYCNKN